MLLTKSIPEKFCGITIAFLTIYKIFFGIFQEIFVIQFNLFDQIRLVKMGR